MRNVTTDCLVPHACLFISIQWSKSETCGLFSTICDFEAVIGKAMITINALLLHIPGEACGLLASVFHRLYKFVVPSAWLLHSTVESKRKKKPGWDMKTIYRISCQNFSSYRLTITAARVLYMTSHPWPSLCNGGMYCWCQASWQGGLYQFWHHQCHQPSLFQIFPLLSKLEETLHVRNLI